MPVVTNDDVDLFLSGAGDIPLRVNAKPERYRMRASRATDPKTVFWEHTAIDFVGTYAGYPVIELSDIRFVGRVPAGAP